jgi:hypothetical protein
MYSSHKYLVDPIDDHDAVNNRISGGFPHSDIPGSKGALTSPGLIAECHVLHRLLSPRHPPNALLALDTTRKSKDIRIPSGQPKPPLVSCIDLERQTIHADRLSLMRFFTM